MNFKATNSLAGMDWWVCSYWMVEDDILIEYGLTLPGTDPNQIERDFFDYGQCGIKVVGKHIGTIE